LRSSTGSATKRVREFLIIDVLPFPVVENARIIGIQGS